MWQEISAQREINQSNEYYLQLARTLTEKANPFIDAPGIPDSLIDRVVTVREWRFFVSDGEDIPATDSMATCIAVGFYSPEDHKAAVAHLTTGNDPESLITDMLQAMYPGEDPHVAAKKIKAVMRGGTFGIQSSEDLTVGIMRSLLTTGIDIVGAELSQGGRSGDAFGIDPQDGQIYLKARGIEAHGERTPKDYDLHYLKPLVQVYRPAE